MKPGVSLPPHRRRFGHKPYDRHLRRRFLFLRFARIFGFLALLILGGLATLAWLVTRWLTGDGQMPVLVWVGGLLLGVGLPLVGWGIAGHAFQDIARPLADLMDAADAVAVGDLRVHVAEESPGDFGRLAQTFNRMTRELERAEVQRRNFTADVAHELRTPLHIIQGNLEGLLDGVYQPTAEHITALLDETRWLARLIDDLRLLSLAESGQLVLHKEAIAVDELLTDISTSFCGQAESKGIQLYVAGKDKLAGMTVNADVGRLYQILGNLVVNALRYTPSGGTITLKGERVPGGVHLIVRDTGQGIALEDIPSIFDRFWRGDTARSRMEGAGGGLGLSIARQLALAHGGRIEVESQPGQGATFTVHLPADDGEASIGVEHLLLP
ncbi:MAG TPA: ATP-binding protein [Ktedonobacteraceae bacterium]|nr:ATP-binding protein [Ktedonobacteraceae bacterium]